MLIRDAGVKLSYVNEINYVINTRNAKFNSVHAETLVSFLLMLADCESTSISLFIRIDCMQRLFGISDLANSSIRPLFFWKCVISLLFFRHCSCVRRRVQTLANDRYWKDFCAGVPRVSSSCHRDLISHCSSSTARIVDVHPATMSLDQSFASAWLSGWVDADRHQISTDYSPSRHAVDSPTCISPLENCRQSLQTKNPMLTPGLHGKE